MNIWELLVQKVYAIDGIEFKSSVGLDVSKCPSVYPGGVPNPDFLPCYINTLVSFFIQAAVILAVLMILVGGFQWLMAIGNQGKVGNAKSTISGAILGLIFALTAYVILAQINTNLVKLKGLDEVGLIEIEPIAVGLSTKCGPTALIQTSKFSIFTVGNIQKNQLGYAVPGLPAALEKADTLLKAINPANFPVGEDSKKVSITSVNDDNALSGACTRVNGVLQGGKACQHGKNSAHYGGTKWKCDFTKDDPPVSCAVDLVARLHSDSANFYPYLQQALTMAGMTAFCEDRDGVQEPCSAAILIHHLHASLQGCSDDRRKY